MGDTEVLIVGGGVIGLAIARSLRKAGVRDVAILEARTPGCQASSAAAGMLAPQAEADRADLFFEFCRESLSMYPTFAEELLSETGIDVELERSGTLYLAFDMSDVEALEERFLWQKRANLRVEKLDSGGVLKRERNLSPDVLMGLYFPDDWQVENRKLVAALRRYAELNDITIYENSKVDEVLVDNGAVIGARSGNRRYLAKSVILTTGAWTSNIQLGESAAPVKIKPIRGQMISYRPSRALISHVIYSRRGYLVPRADGRILVGATVEDAGFENVVTQTGLQSLRTAAAEMLPPLREEAVVEKWSGLRPFAEDGLPVIGRVEGFDGLLMATGHYRNGILLAPKTGELIASHLTKGASSAYLESFGVARFRHAVNASG